MSRFNLPRLIGITGLAGSGKDTFADYLVSQHGYVKYALSSPLKKLLNERFGWTDEMWNDRAWKESPALSGVFSYGGHIGCQDPLLSPRQMAQWLGTEVGRVIGGEDCWVDMMSKHWLDLNVGLVAYRTSPGVTKPYMVVPDVRFDNEARRIIQHGGVMLRVVRPGIEAVNSHVSERGVDNSLVQTEVVNDSDIITFLRNCVYALEACPRGV